MKFIIATHNLHKIEEFARILTPLGIEAVPQEAAGISMSAEEDGQSFAENAEKKARAVAKQTNCAVIADDSGLCIDALDGAPGIYSARWFGEDTPYSQKNQMILDKLSKTPWEQRSAQFVCAICCIFPNGERLLSQGVCRGHIGLCSRGEGGFGYDPIFYVDGKSLAEILPQQKDRISHRGIALRDFSEKLSKYLEQRNGINAIK